MKVSGLSLRLTPVDLLFHQHIQVDFLSLQSCKFKEFNIPPADQACYKTSKYTEPCLHQEFLHSPALTI